jgi:hypothetical protein
VTLISIDSPDYATHLSAIDDGHTIALDLEWDDELCLFQFCSSSGVLVIRHRDGAGDATLRSFLSSHKFYAKGIATDLKMLHQKFGDTFSDNIEDIARTRLSPYGHSLNFVQMTMQFAGAPTAEFKDAKISTSQWSAEILTARQVLYAAFDVVALFVAFPNFPPPGQMPPKPPKVRERIEKPPGIRPAKKAHKLVYRPIAIRSDTHFYIIRGFRGDTLCSSLRSLFSPTDLDHIFSTHDLLFLSLFRPLRPTEFASCQITEVPGADPSFCFDTDDFYLTGIPPALCSFRELNAFLYAFGTDHSVTFYGYYAYVISRSAVNSHRLRTFLPHLFVIHEFPFFLQSVYCANLPPDATLSDLRQFFSQCPGLSSLSYSRCRDAILKFTSESSASSFVDQFDLCTFRGRVLRLTLLCDFPKRRQLLRFAVPVPEDADPASLKAEYSRFGPIFFAGDGAVQFFRRADAIRAGATGPAPVAAGHAPDWKKERRRQGLVFRSAVVDLRALCGPFGIVIDIVMDRFVLFDCTRSAEAAFESLRQSFNVAFFSIDDLPHFDESLVREVVERPVAVMESASEEIKVVVADPLPDGVGEREIADQMESMGRFEIAVGRSAVEAENEGNN